MAVQLATGETVAQELRFLAQMQAQRVTFESLWQQVAERVLPRDNIFFRSGQIIQGEKRTEKQFDSTAALALERFVAAFKSHITPDSSRWHKLGPADQRLIDTRSVTTYLEDVTDVLFAARYSPQANFSQEIGKCFQSLGAFGPWAMYTDEEIGQHLRYRAVPLAQLYFAASHSGVIDKIYRKYLMTARQIKQEWPTVQLPANIERALTVSPESEFEILHCVRPRENVERGGSDYRAMPWLSYYIAIDGKMMLEEGGYRVNPYAVGGYVAGAGETYTRGPCVTMLADIKMLDEMNKTVMRAAHRVVSPPVLLSDDGALSGFDLRPDALNWGGVDSRGQPMAIPFITDAKIEIGLEMMDQKRKSINDGLLVSLFQILVEDRRDMTAYETAIRDQEKGALIAPAMGSQQPTIGRIIEREIDLLARAGQLPPMPQELIDAGGLIKIEYSSPLTQLMRADEGASIMQTMGALESIGQLHPEVYDSFDMVEVGRIVGQLRRMPPKTVRSPEDTAKVTQERTQQQAMAQAAAAAPGVAGAVKDVADAHATTQSAQQPQQGASA